MQVLQLHLHWMQQHVQTVRLCRTTSSNPNKINPYRLCSEEVMNEQTATELRERLDKFDECQSKINKIKKASDTLEAIGNEGEHDVQEIVFRVPHKEIAVRIKGEANPRRVCTFSNEEHTELTDLFIEWAREKLDNRIAALRQEMNEL